MVLGVGLVSAIIISKKNPNYKTRLQKLQLKLDKNPLTQTTLYEIPTKRIITIFIIIVFILIFNHFQQSFRRQLIEANSSSQSLASSSLHLANIQNRTHSTAFEIYEVNERADRVSSVLMWVKIAYFFMVVGVVVDLRWKVVKITGELIEMKQYDRSNLGRCTRIKWDKSDCRIQIVSKGQQKLTHYTSHLSLDIISKSSKQVHQLIRRSHIFQARKTIIQIGSVLQFEPDLRIH